MMHHSPRKRFGQNFLQDQHIIHLIFKALYPKPKDNIIEIGPGLGALTQPLLKLVPELTVIEIDRDLQQHLFSLKEEHLKIIAADALKVDYSQFGTDIRILGNLPYNISTPIIMHLLQYAHLIKDMHFMLQKEVVERMVAVPGGKEYGRLSIAIQYLCSVEHLFNVDAASFFPKPKVDSAFIRLMPYQTSPYAKIEFNKLENLVRQAFSMRRKTLANNLKSIISGEDLTKLNIDPGLRPEQIPIQDYVQIVKYINK